jgi:hypothetical protein
MIRLLSLVPLVVALLQQPPQGSIEGRITRQGSTQAVAAARVSLMRPGQAPSAVVTVPADAGGKFSFQGIAAGNYTLQVQADGYVAQTYGRRFPQAPAGVVTLTADQLAVKDIDVSLTPAATISGRIRDASGKPLMNVPVRLLRTMYTFTGQRTFEPSMVVPTNDRGEYRLFWVKPGRYYVVAGQSFYPGVAEFDRAQAVELKPGADRAADPGIHDG